MQRPGVWGKVHDVPGADPSGTIGADLARRLEQETLIDLSTAVGRKGRSRPMPVWFLWDGSSFLIYSLGTAKRLDNIRRDPSVELSLEDPDSPGAKTVIHGTARIAEEEPSPDQHPTWLPKYHEKIVARPGRTPAAFAQQYSVPLRITPTRVEQRSPQRS